MGAKVIMMLLSIPKRIFNSETSILQWKSKLRKRLGTVKTRFYILDHD